MVDEAEQFLAQRGAPSQVQRASTTLISEDYLKLAAVRNKVSELAGRPMLTQCVVEELFAGYASRDDIADIASRGPVTPDHSLHTKRTAAILGEDAVAGIETFAADYAAYFSAHDTSANKGTLTRLDTAPRVAIWRNKGVLAIGPNAKRVGVVRDIAEHTLQCVQWAEALGGWQALPEKDIFELEYWELEQAKLKRMPTPAAFEGRIALVTGAASGIGKACVEALSKQGCAVIALDIAAAVLAMEAADICAVQCDVTDGAATLAAIESGVARFGGIDILVSNAGGFPASTVIEQLDDEALSASLTLNFQSHASLLRQCTPFLKLGIKPAVVLMASKNVPAPGPGAAAYSTAKAALTQLGRVAALELGGDGIRVNMLHPNAVYDTGVWTEEVLQARADSYGLSVEAYKANNVLGMEVSSSDVASAVLALTGNDFTATTGAQIPIDGGNDRVI
jgi:NAD(P)-dependent dehydrogenase (short-subunit alcohol dehydrogenase family)